MRWAEVSNRPLDMYRMTHERCLTSSGPAWNGLPRNSVRGGRAMGRGRAKAKQTKVARELKYHSPNTDLAALQRELGSGTSNDQFDDLEELEDDGADDEPEDDDEDELAARWGVPPR